MTSPQDWHEVEKLTRRVFDAVDWRVLGDVYFHEDGEQHWADRRKLVVELGSQLARRLARQVERDAAGAEAEGWEVRWKVRREARWEELR